MVPYLAPTMMIPIPVRHIPGLSMEHTSPECGMLSLQEQHAPKSRVFPNLSSPPSLPLSRSSSLARSLPMHIPISFSMITLRWPTSKVFPFVVIRRQIVTNNFESVSLIFYDLACPQGLTALTCSCLSPNGYCSLVDWENHKTHCVFWFGFLNITGDTFQANALCGIGTLSICSVIRDSPALHHGAWFHNSASWCYRQWGIADHDLLPKQLYPLPFSSLIFS